MKKPSEHVCLLCAMYMFNGQCSAGNTPTICDSGEKGMTCFKGKCVEYASIKSVAVEHHPIGLQAEFLENTRRFKEIMLDTEL